MQKYKTDTSNIPVHDKEHNVLQQCYSPGCSLVP